MAEHLVELCGDAKQLRHHGQNFRIASAPSGTGILDQDQSSP
jgi:hypothetical protein